MGKEVEKVVKAYIQDLCGDEDSLDIDRAILQCLLQDAIFEKFMGPPIKITAEEAEDALYKFLQPFVDICIPAVRIDLILKRGDDDEGITSTLLL